MSLGDLKELPKACWKELAFILERLIHPASELAIHRWFNEQSALCEMLETDIRGLGKDRFYAIGDRLFEKSRDCPLISLALMVDGKVMERVGCLKEKYKGFGIVNLIKRRKTTVNERR
ncbi:hypothetical protein [Acetobacterium sp.]|uniref:hypothetical protein n=1 Tax=Acetobacterium sp. TaxID=1872094 RepID=UPI002F3FA72D